MGPIAFVIVFMLVPLAAAVFAGAFFASLGIYRLLSAVPTGAWAGVAVVTGLYLAARLSIVLRAIYRTRPGVGQGPHALEEPGVGAPGGAAKPPEASLGGAAS